MQFKVTSNGVTTDYAKYLYGGMQKTDNTQAPNLLDFALFSFDDIKYPGAGAYILVQTGTYGDWFSGYITSDPELEYIGTEGPGPRWVLKYKATSDDFILNRHPLGMIPPFVNTTQGQILKQLIARLSPPGVTFDTGNINDGMFVPRFVVDPNQHFKDVIANFCKSANFTYRVLNHGFSFHPKDATPCSITIDGNSPDFTPSRLQVQPTTDTIINDAIVIGGIEPQSTMSEFFVGDGITAKFPLISGVYGADSSTLLDDDFSGSTINNQKWTVYDDANTYIQPVNGFVNCLGGPNDGSHSVFLQSSNLIPLEGSLRLTHGEFDFIQPSTGFIGCLFSGPVTANVANMVYGIEVGVYPAAGGTFLHPYCNGAIDFTQGFKLDFTKRYIIRTVFHSDRVVRQHGQYSYLDSEGNVVQLPGGASTGTGSFYTWITEIDPNTGGITNRIQFTNTSLHLTAAQTYAYYVPAILENLWCTFTSVTVSVPILAQLYHKAKGSTSWHAVIIGPNEVDSYDGLAPAASITDGNQGATTKSSLLGTKNYNPGQSALQYFSDQPVPIPSNILAAENPDLAATPNPIRVPFGSTTGSTLIQWANAPSAKVELWMNGAGFGSGGTKVATGGQSGNYQANDIPNGTTFYLMNVIAGSPGVLVDQLTIEIQQMYIPQAGDLIWLIYRSAGAAIGRAQDFVSIAAQAAAWDDDGVRSETVMNINPPPRTSFECEIAASAIVQGSNYQHYQGEYEMASGPWFVGEPMSGTILRFVNLPPDFPQYLKSEAVTQVVSTMVHSRGREVFHHQLSFGPVDKESAALSTLRSTADVFTPQDSAEVPVAIDVRSLGATNVPDVNGVSLDSWDPNYYYFSTLETPPTGGGFEVRYTDASWGCDPAKNLITRTTGQTFKVPRNARGKVCWIRAYDTRNWARYSEDNTNSVWSTLTATVSQARAQNPDGDYSMISTLHSTAAGGYVLQQCPGNARGQTMVFSVSVKGTKGQFVTLEVNSGGQSQIQTFALNGFWQRLSISKAFSLSASPSSTAIGVSCYAANQSVQLTRWQLEASPSGIQTTYCKTLGSAYGATSRFSCGVHVGLPLIPPAPTATVGLANQQYPTVSITLPQVLIDVWGVEIRTSDNHTIIAHMDLINAGYTPTYTMPHNLARSGTYYVYTYNILGEYSAPFVATFTIPVPNVGVISMIESTKSLSITSQYALSLFVEIIQPPPNGPVVHSFSIPIGDPTIVTTSLYTLADQYFLPGTYFRVTPFDAVGSGVAKLFGHTYFPQGVVQLTGAEVAPLLSPITPVSLPPTPNAAAGFLQEAQNTQWHNYILNKFREEDA